MRKGENQSPISWVRKGKKYRAAAVICYEDLSSKVFSQLINKEVPEFLIVATNDAWFLHSIAALQHGYVARWRAVEFGKSLIRASNDALTLVVNSLGDTLLELVPFETSFGAVKVPLISTNTIFAKYGNLPILFVKGIIMLLAKIYPLFFRLPHIEKGI